MHHTCRQFDRRAHVSAVSNLSRKLSIVSKSNVHVVPETKATSLLRTMFKKTPMSPENLVLGFQVLKSLRTEAQGLPPVQQKMQLGVGAVVEHVESGKFGVVVQCDPSCNVHIVSDPKWKYGCYQPFYACYFEAATRSEEPGLYVPQELLKQVTPKKIPNSNIDSLLVFVDGKYVPKESLVPAETTEAYAASTTPATPLEE